jgi:hypothetical protein
MEVPFSEIFIPHQLLMKRHGCFDAFDDEFIQCPFHLGDALFASTGPADQFGNQRVIIRRNRITGINMSIYANAMPFGRMEGGDPSRRGA